MLELTPLNPRDEFNRALEMHVHPPDWENPSPSGRYNLVVVGGGTAGLVTAAGAAGLGAKIALIERYLLGGDCLNVGCVPSKSIISAARVAATIRTAGRFGVNPPSEVDVDFAAVMERLRRLRASIAPHDSAARFRDMGVDVYFGEARFTGRDTIAVGRESLRFARAAICTGARPTVPPVPGLDQLEFLTNESVFSLTDRPSRLAVIGAGPIGCELAQAFARLGSRVWIIEAGHGVLPREDRDCAEIVQRGMEADGVQVLCCGRQVQMTPAGSAARISGESHDDRFDIEVDRVLVCVGRTPNVDGLGLDAAGVEFDGRTGVQVNDRLRTTNPRIYAAGDVCSEYRFTHAADFMARILIQNALFHGRRRLSRLIIPGCTYTSPEIAHVGMHEADAGRDGVAIDVYSQPLSGVDRAVLDGETEGLVKVLVRKGSDQIVGATIVAAHAGEMINEITLAMTQRLGLKRIADTIHPYPTQAEAIRKLGDQYNRTRLTPLVQSLFARWLKWTR